MASGYYGNMRWQHSEKRHIMEDIGPQKLTFDQLQLGFLFCLIPLIVSGVVFIMELTVNFASMQIPRMSMYFAIKAFEQRIIVGPEKFQLEENEEEVTTVESLSIASSINSDDVFEVLDENTIIQPQ